ncbi:MAG: DUF4274 domain-containing protein [Pelagimonas sp.]|jgi:hypothetical protein|nr:DUF4274 domain-containing protein [Pelagimonas sp.]
MEIARAYHEGLQDLDSNQAYGERTGGFLGGFGSVFKQRRLGADSEHRYYLLPLAVAGYRMRMGQFRLAEQSWPEFGDLTSQEQMAAAYLLEYMEADTGKKIDMAVARSWIQEPLLGLRDLGTKPLLVSQLPPLNQSWSSDPHNAVICAVEALERMVVRAPEKKTEAFEISTDSADFMTWLSKQRDPNLWHQIASGGLNWGLECNVATAAWIVDQPECDPATAAGLFLNFQGQDIVGLPVDAALGSVYPAFLINICQNAQALAAKPARLALTDFGLKNNQTKWAQDLDQLYADRAQTGKACVPSPSPLFAAPYKGRRRSGWSVHSETFIQRDV